MVDKEGIMHVCVQAGITPFLGLKSLANLPNRVYTDSNWEELQIAEKFHESTCIKVEIIDISESFAQGLKLLRKRSIRTPQFVINGVKVLM